MDSNAVLLERIRLGDERALNQLANACLHDLRRFAHGRLPRWARGLVTTQDIVHEALSKALRKIETFDLRHEGAFIAYARKAVVREVIDQMRRASARPFGPEITDALASDAPSPVEEAVGREFIERYERALQSLTPEQLQAFVLRIEFGYSHERVAEAIGAPSPEAARMLVKRAVLRLQEALSEFGPNQEEPDG